MKIDRRFNGPPTSAHGGVAAGLVAQCVGAPSVEVTLRKPPPLDTELEWRDGALYDGDLLLAEGRAADVDLEPRPAVTLEAARAAALPDLPGHPFPTCYGCGTGRTDGLRLLAGPVAGGGVATTWTPATSDLVGVWAALDCPSGFAADLSAGPMLLGRMTGRVDRLPEVGVEHVISAWLVSREGRRATTGVQLTTASGELLALAKAVWFAV